MNTPLSSTSTRFYSINPLSAFMCIILFHPYEHLGKHWFIFCHTDGRMDSQSWWDTLSTVWSIIGGIESKAPAVFIGSSFPSGHGVTFAVSDPPESEQEEHSHVWTSSDFSATQLLIYSLSSELVCCFLKSLFAVFMLLSLFSWSFVLLALWLASRSLRPG